MTENHEFEGMVRKEVIVESGEGAHLKELRILTQYVEEPHSIGLWSVDAPEWKAWKEVNGNVVWEDKQGGRRIIRKIGQFPKEGNGGFVCENSGNWYCGDWEKVAVDSSERINAILSDGTTYNGTIDIKSTYYSRIKPISGTFRFDNGTTYSGDYIYYNNNFFPMKLTLGSKFYHPILKNTLLRCEFNEQGRYFDIEIIFRNSVRFKGVLNTENKPRELDGIFTNPDNSKFEGFVSLPYLSNQTGSGTFYPKEKWIIKQVGIFDDGFLIGKEYLQNGDIVEILEKLDNQHHRVIISYSNGMQYKGTTSQYRSEPIDGQGEWIGSNKIVFKGRWIDRYCDNCKVLYPNGEHYTGPISRLRIDLAKASETRFHSSFNFKTNTGKFTDYSRRETLICCPDYSLIQTETGYNVVYSIKGEMTIIYPDGNLLYRSSPRYMKGLFSEIHDYTISRFFGYYIEGKGVQADYGPRCLSMHGSKKQENRSKIFDEFFGFVKSSEVVREGIVIGNRIIEGIDSNSSELRFIRGGYYSIHALIDEFSPNDIKNNNLMIQIDLQNKITWNLFL